MRIGRVGEERQADPTRRLIVGGGLLAGAGYVAEKVGLLGAALAVCDALGGCGRETETAALPEAAASTPRVNQLDRLTGPDADWMQQNIAKYLQQKDELDLTKDVLVFDRVDWEQTPHHVVVVVANDVPDPEAEPPMPIDLSDQYDRDYEGRYLRVFIYSRAEKGCGITEVKLPLVDSAANRALASCGSSKDVLHVAFDVKFGQPDGLPALGPIVLKPEYRKGSETTFAYKAYVANATEAYPDLRRSRSSWPPGAYQEYDDDLMPKRGKARREAEGSYADTTGP